MLFTLTVNVTTTYGMLNTDRCSFDSDSYGVVYSSIVGDVPSFDWSITSRTMWLTSRASIPDISVMKYFEQNYWLKK